jgi:hypothetical protein
MDDFKPELLKALLDWVRVNGNVEDCTEHF